MSKRIVFWTTYAKHSYFEELAYIQLKWTSKEVHSFIVLVDEVIENLANGIIQGKNYSNSSIHSIVISKQTTVFYRTNPNQNSIALLLFWNNQKDPVNLQKMLESM